MYVNKSATGAVFPLCFDISGLAITWWAVAGGSMRHRSVSTGCADLTDSYLNKKMSPSGGEATNQHLVISLLHLQLVDHVLFYVLL